MQLNIGLELAPKTGPGGTALPKSMNIAFGPLGAAKPNATFSADFGPAAHGQVGDAPSGTYQVAVQIIDAAGAPMGDPLTLQLVMPANTVDYLFPVGLTANLSA